MKNLTDWIKEIEKLLGLTTVVNFENRFTIFFEEAEFVSRTFYNNEEVCAYLEGLITGLKSC